MHFAFSLSQAAVPGADGLGKQPNLRRPKPDEVREAVVAWLDQCQASPSQRAEALALWPEGATESPEELLQPLAATFAFVEEDARRLAALCSQPRRVPQLPSFPLLVNDGAPPFVRHNLRLFYARWLCQERLYDEALEQLAGLQPQQVVDPAALLFYQAVAHHRLVEKAPALEAVRRLLTDVDAAPRRYESVARLMEADLSLLPDEADELQLRGMDDLRRALDPVSRQMDDIGRRLDLGRAGPKVRQIEDDVVARLDKLIDELEKLQQQQQGGGASGNNAPSTPAPDSRILGGRGPGEVDKKPIGNKSGWGDLPPKQREEALQQIGKDFPAHYREVIEQYFRKLAGEK